MRGHLAGLLLVVGCVGASQPAKAPTSEPAPVAAADPDAPLDPISIDPTDAARENAEVAALPPPEPPMLEPPPPAPTRPLHERLFDAPGPVPGLPGFSLSHRPSKHRCGGIEVVTKRSKRVAPDDTLLAEMFAIEYPRGLNFDPANRKRAEASLKKFNAWLETLKQTAARATKHYETQLTATNEVASAARIAQVLARFGSVFARVPIPEDVRTGEYADEKVVAFCDALTTAAESVVTQTEAAVKRCAELAIGQPPGWWTTFCVVAP